MKSQRLFSGGAVLIPWIEAFDPFGLWVLDCLFPERQNALDIAERVIHVVPIDHQRHGLSRHSLHHESLRYALL